MATIAHYDVATNLGSSMQGGLLIHQFGETFTATSSATLTSVQFKLSKIGSPTGNAVASIWNITGTMGTNAKPTGSALAVSDNFDVTTLTGTPTFSTLTFSGINQITLNGGSNYAVTVNFAGGDSSNLLNIFSVTPSTDAVGNRCFLNGSTWGGDNAAGIMYYVFGTGLPTTYTMICTPASFSYTAQTEGNYRVLTMPCTPATYTLTGIANGMKKIWQMATQATSYVYTGLSATITTTAKFIYTMVCLPAVYSLTGLISNLAKRIGWTRQSQNTSSWTMQSESSPPSYSPQSKSSSSWNSQSKSSTPTFTPQTKDTSSWTPQNKS